MARPRTIWWRTGLNCYYTTIDGKKVRLCKDLDESRRKLARILGGPPEGGGGVTFAEVADRFLEHSRATNASATVESHERLLAGFRSHVGPRRFCRLTEADLDEWVRKHEWADNTRTLARSVVLACVNYGVRRLNAGPHPLPHARAGTWEKRGRVLTATQRAAVKEEIQGPLADFVRVLELTGARPFSEVAKVTAADVDVASGKWVLREHKNRKKKRVPRATYLVPEAMDVVRRLIALHPDGPIFRNRYGKPWKRQAVTARFRVVAGKLELPGLGAYTFRHCYITDALARGVPAAVVAELCGTSIQTIERHYRHLDQKQDVLREAALKAVGG